MRLMTFRLSGNFDMLVAAYGQLDTNSDTSPKLSNKNGLKPSFLIPIYVQ